MVSERTIIEKATGVEVVVSTGNPISQNVVSPAGSLFIDKAGPGVYVSSGASWTLLQAGTVSWTSITGKPTTIAGYGITDFNSLGDARYVLKAGDIMTGALKLRVNALYFGAADGQVLYSTEVGPVTYGTLRVGGQRNGYAGFYFDDFGYNLMANGTGYGQYHPSYGWRFMFNGLATDAAWSLTVVKDVNAAGVVTAAGEIRAGAYAGGGHVAGDITARRSATTGVYYLGDGTTSYLYFDGTSYIFGGTANLYANEFVISGTYGFGVIGGTTGLFHTRESYMGYSVGYKVVILGDLGGTNRSIAIGVDLTGNTSGAFSGGGVEVFWKNAIKWVMPNAANNNYLSMIAWDSAANATFGGSLFVAGRGSFGGSAAADSVGDIRARRSATTGIIYFGDGTNYIYWDGSNYYAGAFLIIHNGNYTSYSPGLTGSGASGTWAINVTGFAGTLQGWVVHPNRDTTFDYNAAGRANGYYSVDSTGTNGPGPSYLSLLHLTNSTDVVFQLAGGYVSDGLYFRGGSNWTAGTGWGTWRTVLHNANFNTYAPTLGGTGATGTWPIAISGNAAGTLQGFNVATTATVNTIALRDSSGDLYARYGMLSYVNTVDDASSGAGLTYLLGKCGDNYHRSVTAANVLTWLNFPGVAFVAASVTSNTFVRATTYFYADQNYGYGLVGVYDSTKYRLVYAMGGSYLPATDGSTLGGLYGIFYAYDNVAGKVVSGLSLGHGMGIAEGGTPRAYIGYGGIWTAGQLYCAGAFNSVGVITENSVPVAKVVLTTAAISTADAAPASGEGTLRIRYI